MSLYDANQQIKLTVVNGLTRTGVYAVDGSYNVVTNDGTGAKLPVYHACGAYNATITTNAAAGYYSPNNSMNIIANATGYTPVMSTYVKNATSGFTPLAGATIDMDVQNNLYFGGTLATLMDGTQTNAIGALLSTLQGANLSIVLSLKIAVAPVTWLAASGGSQTFLIRGATDTTAVTRDNLASPVTLTATAGSGAFSTTPSKIGVSFSATGRSIVMNNGTVVTDAQVVSIAPSNVAFTNFNTQFNRCTVWNTRLSDVALKGFTV